ncbi:MAG: HD domain-containing phosphohydrolase [Planctomycetota bacterium]
MQNGRRTPQRRVLVVDDDPAALASIERLLRDHGFAVTCHGEVSAAAEAMRSQCFDLVVTDLYLTDEHLGYEIARLAQSSRPALPVILVTAHPSLEGAHEAIRSRVSQIVVKPVDGAALVAACTRAIDEWEMRCRNDTLEAQVRILRDVLPRCIEANDPMTAGHSERVVGYAETLGELCDLEDEDMEALRLASLLHDVGKIGIPERILAKEGPLTRQEREEIKKHPSVGYEILAPLHGNDKARLWVYQHHERWDGRGYPEGVAGEEVALAGRILILAEVYDALRSARSYKAAWEVSAIVDFFRQEAGKHFDPDLAHIVADGLEQKGPRFFARERDSLF